MDRPTRDESIMDADIEKRLEKLVEATTSKAAINEWIEATQKQKIPLYNYRFDHVRQVVKLAKHLAENTDADMEIITFAAWLHDLDKPGVGGRISHGKASAEQAADTLNREHVNQELICKVSDVVRKHVGLTLKEPLQPLEAQILWEADKILKLGIIGLMQSLLNGIRLFPGRSLEDIAKDVREFRGLATQISECMVTDNGKKIAHERLKTLFWFSERLDSEIAV
jgi:HD superfamily phosphodiesterase